VRTPLHAQHQAAGARFVDFGGYEMPVQYTSVVAEHQAVRQKVGLFDVSHMGEFVVEGDQALDALQYAVTNDVARLQDGGALYTVMCREDGGIIDDLIVYRERQDRYFLVVNASRRGEDWQHLTTLCAGRAVLTDVSDATALLAVQGPQALTIVAALGYDVRHLRPFQFMDRDSMRVSRTGYTGEDGVELYFPAQEAAARWQAIVEAGTPLGLALCGLAARDSLRTEMKYPLYGQDIDLTCNPLEAGLSWVVKWNKEFLGRTALVAIDAQGPARKLIGFKMVDRGIPRPGYRLFAAGVEVGKVTSGTHSPSLGLGIGIGYVPRSLDGCAIAVEIRGRLAAGEIVSTPFYRRGLA
jgi:aminomethyltransferase